MQKACKRNGYNRNLYRSSNQGWIAGVCAGLAESYGQPVWLARIIFLTLFLFSGSLAVLLYLAGVVLLERRPEAAPRETPRRPAFDYGQPMNARLRQIGERMRVLDQRLQAMERYVTSSRYRFNKEFKDL
ncbi:MAG: envelope stress response membrane protein PspC [Oceanospirillaceae bacterium]|nr:envelope stress response membrane protein PspC [Oceanospirillaceae bacterium]